MKNNIFGEILYIGFVYEKGKIYQKHWFNYRKLFQQQLNIWKEIILRMEDRSHDDEDIEFIECFINICKKENKIGKVYNISANTYIKLEEEIQKSAKRDDVFTSKHVIVIEMMDKLILSLEKEMREGKMINKHKIYMILNVLHNLPRCFLNEKVVYDFSNMAISCDDSIKYAFENMNSEMRQEYIKYNLG